MGLPFDTQAIYEYVLTTDKHKPQKDRACLLFNVPTYRQFLKIDKVFSEAETLAPGEEQFDKYFEAIGTCLSGWKNLPIKYDPENAVESLKDMLSVHEVIETRWRLLDEISANEMDKKKQLLQSLSDAEASATELKDNRANIVPQPSPQNSTASAATVQDASPANSQEHGA